MQLPGVTFSASADVHESYGVVTVGDARAESLRETVRIAREAKNFVDRYFFHISQHKNFDRELKGLSMMVAY